jgi:excisionase family DNA binding protein
MAFQFQVRHYKATTGEVGAHGGDRRSEGRQSKDESSLETREARAKQNGERKRKEKGDILNIDSCRYSECPLFLSSEQAAERLRTTPEKIVAELEAGRLDGFRVGEEWRTTEEALLRFMGIKISPEHKEPIPMTVVAEQVATSPGLDYRAILAGAQWRRIEGFSHRWPGPGENTERFDEGYETTVRIGRKHYRLCIGFCTRASAGDDNRRRAVVFMGHAPSLIALVEFAGEDSDRFATTGRMVSVIKLRGRHSHLRPGMPIPPEYVDLPLVTYNDVVTGPYSAASTAVLAQHDDYGLMAHHGLIRTQWKGYI